MFSFNGFCGRVHHRSVKIPLEQFWWNLLAWALLECCGDLGQRVTEVSGRTIKALLHMVNACSCFGQASGVQVTHVPALSQVEMLISFSFFGNG